MVISVSHLTDATAYQPGTTSRSGAPCRTGSGSPFIEYASSAPDSLASSIARLRSNLTGSAEPSTVPRSAPRKTSSVAPAWMPARSSTSSSRTPVHSAVLTAPSCHCAPSGAGLNRVRPLPAHSSVATKVSAADTFVATLECAGNGRTLFSPAPDGAQWQLGAVSTAEWTGVRLDEVLDRAGIQAGATELVFRGADRGTVDGSAEPVRFERSLAMEDARESGALLAYSMNGEPLPVRHGAPLRLVVPGWYAVASVKWLTDITIASAAFDGYFQTGHYMYELPRGDTVVREPVRMQRVRALITEPCPGQRHSGSELTVRGVAWSGAAPIARVEVSVAGGDWQDARLIGASSTHGWQRWEHWVQVSHPGEMTIRARATDLAGHTQP